MLTLVSRSCGALRGMQRVERSKHMAQTQISSAEVRIARVVVVTRISAINPANF